MKKQLLNCFNVILAKHTNVIIRSGKQPAMKSSQTAARHIRTMTIELHHISYIKN